MQRVSSSKLDLSTMGLGLFGIMVGRQKGSPISSNVSAPMVWHCYYSLGKKVIRHMQTHPNNNFVQDSNVSAPMVWYCTFSYPISNLHIDIEDSAAS